MASSELIVSFSSPSAARHRTRPARSTAVLGLGPIAEETRGVDATAREAVARRATRPAPGADARAVMTLVATTAFICGCSFDGSCGSLWSAPRKSTSHVDKIDESSRDGFSHCMATRSRVRARASNDADRSRVPNLAHVLAVTALAVVVALYVRAGSAHGRVTRPPPTFATKGTEKMTTSASASLGSHPASRKLTVENLILGCSPLAGIYASSTPERATATVRTALEAGFTRFDTAPHYGLGLSERRLGDALRECGADMSTTRVYTKVGRVMKPTHTVTDAEKRGGKVEWGNVPGDPGCIFPDAPVDVLPVLDYTGPGFRRSHDDSLQRMGIERVDGLRIHDAEDEARYNEAVNGGGVAELVKLREEGLINEVSLGMNDANFVRRMLHDNPAGTFDSVMMAGSWNLLDQDGLLVLLECQRRGVKVRVYFYYCTVN